MCSREGESPGKFISHTVLRGSVGRKGSLTSSLEVLSHSVTSSTPVQDATGEVLRRADQKTWQGGGGVYRVGGMTLTRDECEGRLLSLAAAAHHPVCEMSNKRLVSMSLLKQSPVWQRKFAFHTCQMPDSEGNRKFHASICDFVRQFGAGARAPWSGWAAVGKMDKGRSSQVQKGGV